MDTSEGLCKKFRVSKPTPWQRPVKRVLTRRNTRARLAPGDGKPFGYIPNAQSRTASSRPREFSMALAKAICSARASSSSSGRMAYPRD